LQKLLAKVAADCLVANMRPQPPEEIFSRLSQTRTDFAIVLTQRLIQANSTVPEMQGLLSTAWDAIRALRGSFERTVPDTDILYYRSLLKLLFLTIRIHAEAKQQDIAADLRASKRIAQTSSIGPVVMEIINNVVAIGIREIASGIHDSPAESSPEDFALITGILQSCLRIPGIELCHSQIVNMLTQAAVPRLVVTLFSWSDSLAIDGDPIYGELSILFLLELSSIPLMAEQLAIDGVLGHIASASITSYLRGGKVGPFADSAGLQRCYSIWARGILPFLLNLLDAVQVSIAAEVSLFLAQFPNLLKQSEQSLDAPETNRIIPQGSVRYITLTICSETHSMALLSFILNTFRENLKGTVDIPEVKWDASGVLENVEFWLSSTALLRDRLLPMGDREMEMRKKGGQSAASELEKKILIELRGIKDVLNGGENGS
jgi:nuclear pore complex protein Nup188